MLDFEELRLNSHDKEKANEIRINSYKDILKETLNGNLDAAKVLNNLMYHFPDLRISKDQEEVNHILEYIPVKGFIYSRILFWITTSKVENYVIEDLKERVINLLETSDIEITSFNELLNVLINLKKLNMIQSKRLLSIFSQKWNKNCIKAFCIIDPKDIYLSHSDVEEIVKLLVNEDAEVYLLLAILKDFGVKNNRRLFRKSIFPPTSKSSELKEKLAVLLEKNLPENVLVVGYFSLSILNESIKRLMHQFGYEKIAGFLYLTDKLNTSQTSINEGIKELSSDEEDSSSNSIDTINSNMDEIADEELQKIMELFNKLEKSGYIKIYK